jgi:hypothetical protein
MVILPAPGEIFLIFRKKLRRPAFCVPRGNLNDTRIVQILYEGLGLGFV